MIVIEMYTTKKKHEKMKNTSGWSTSIEPRFVNGQTNPFLLQFRYQF